MNKNNTDTNIRDEMLKNTTVLCTSLPNTLTRELTSVNTNKYRPKEHKNATTQYDIIELPDVNLVLYTYESDKIKTEIETPTKIRSVKKSENEEVTYTPVTNNKNVNKVHSYIISAFYEQKSNVIKIPLADFISIGIFKTEKTARRNLEAIMWYLMSIKLSVKDKTRKDKNISLTNIIYKSDIENGVLIVKLDEDYYRNILEVFTRLPNWAYKASSQTFSLICKLLEYERVNRRKGNDTNTLTFYSLANSIGLPYSDETYKHSDHITNPLQKCFKELDELQKYEEYKIDYEIERTVDYKNISDYYKTKIHYKVDERIIDAYTPKKSKKQPKKRA